MFIPPSVELPVSNDTKTHFSPIHDSLLEEDVENPVILGVDEAGRGPVLGPMVYGVAYTRKGHGPVLTKYGFDDSKKLTEEKRTELMQLICDEAEELHNTLGWATTSITARDISSGMLRPRQSTYNLNEQAHDTTIALIKGVLDHGVPVREIYVDTVGPPVPYQRKLQSHFPMAKVTVTKKADSLFPIVSAASIVAKTTRDSSLQQSAIARGEEHWGSGYPSDPRTSKWLNAQVDPLFGWDQNIRYSWQTSKDAMKRSGALEFTWEDDIPEREEYGLRVPKKKIRCDWFVRGV